MLRMFILLLATKRNIVYQLKKSYLRMIKRELRYEAKFTYLPIVIVRHLLPMGTNRLDVDSHERGENRGRTETGRIPFKPSEDDIQKLYAF